MGTPEGNLQAEFKILKKFLNKKKSKKNCISYIKSEKGQKYALTELAGPTQNPKKNYRNIKSTNQRNFSLNKYV
jgi:hypothetical protein